MPLARVQSNSEIEVILEEANELAGQRCPAAGESGLRRAALKFRLPRAGDGPRIAALIAASPPLDTNSTYCNLLQCSDFADTCIVAERGDAIVGWISAYRPPSAPDRLFVWQ
ncbi:MAG: hypothetical protein ABIY39_09830, partial [Sphingomonas sp.]